MNDQDPPQEPEYVWDQDAAQASGGQSQGQAIRQEAAQAAWFGSSRHYQRSRRGLDQGPGSP